MNTSLDLAAKGASRDIAVHAPVVRASKPRQAGLISLLLKPLGLTLAAILFVFALVSLGTTWWRSYERHLVFNAPVHSDNSIARVLTGPRVSGDEVELIVRDIGGTLHQLAAGRGARDKFVNETLRRLDTERAVIKKAASRRLDAVFTLAFAESGEAISRYADWFFEWKRSYVVLKEVLASSAARMTEPGKYESLREAVEHDVKEYFLRHYMARVLRPEVHGPAIARGFEDGARAAHESYRRVIANGELQLQLFLSRHTRHMETIPAGRALTKLSLDWDAQKWKAPAHLAEDQAFRGLAGAGGIAAGGAAGARLLGPAVNRAASKSFSMLARRFSASMARRLAFAGRGAAVGTVVEPVGGQIAGAAAGVVLAVAVDYFAAKTHEKFNREEFITANREALDATLKVWRVKLEAGLHDAIDTWFDDAQKGVVAAGK